MTIYTPIERLNTGPKKGARSDAAQAEGASCTIAELCQKLAELRVPEEVVPHVVCAMCDFTGWILPQRVAGAWHGLLDAAIDLESEFDQLDSQHLAALVDQWFGEEDITPWSDYLQLREAISALVKRLQDPAVRDKQEPRERRKSQLPSDRGRRLHRVRIGDMSLEWMTKHKAFPTDGQLLMLVTDALLRRFLPKKPIRRDVTMRVLELAQRSKAEVASFDRELRRAAAQLREAAIASVDIRSKVTVRGSQGPDRKRAQRSRREAGETAAASRARRLRRIEGLFEMDLVARRARLKPDAVHAAYDRVLARKPLEPTDVFVPPIG